MFLKRIQLSPNNPKVWNRKQYYQDLCILPKDYYIPLQRNIEWTQILDRILIANEGGERLQKKEAQRVCCKAGVRKSLHKTDWNFLDYILARKGFGAKWRSWVFGCLSSAHFSIILNGSLKVFSRPQRALRRRSPFALSFYSSCQLPQPNYSYCWKLEGFFKGFQVGSETVKVSHLQFLDDTLILAEGNEKNVLVLKVINPMLLSWFLGLKLIGQGAIYRGNLYLRRIVRIWHVNGLF